MVHQPPEMSVPTVDIPTASEAPIYDATYSEQSQETPNPDPEDIMEHVNRIIADEKPEQPPGVQGQVEDGTNVDDISPEERQRQEEMPRNPKKRMWEENTEGQKQGKKDEL